MPTEVLPFDAPADPSARPAEPVLSVVPKAPASVPTDVELGGGAHPFNFRQPSLLTAGELRKLRLRHDEFCRALTTRLSIFFRLEFGAQILGFETIPYPKFISILANPTHVVLFKVESLDGVGLIEMPPKLGIAIVDRLLGGPGKSVALSRDLSEIEVELLNQALQPFLQEWCRAVALLPEATPALLAHETNPRYLQTASNETNMLVLALGIRITDCAEKVHLAFPFSMLEALIRQLNPSLETKKENTTAPPAAVEWNTEFNSLKVPLSAEWEGIEINTRQLVQLKVGDILPIDPQHANHTHVRLAKVRKFIARLGRCGNTWAVELTQSIKD
ncbi:MAG TPA: FliM/FliN family flagellar motor switch protein [Verrucomicrobiae bacterium]|jgi:flagellar motor switch protein FliM